MEAEHGTDDKTPLERGVDNLREPFSAFIRAQTTAAALLLVALLLALVAANTQLAPMLDALEHYPIGISFGERRIEWSLKHFVNDGLIAIFFVLIGLEVKRELLAGELRDGKRVGLLVSAALGGIVVPAGLYLTLNSAFSGVPGGWGIPMATDTAIAIGVLAALSRRVPRSAVAFLVGVAILDDIAAILAIALVYTREIDWRSLLAAALLLALLGALNRAGIRKTWVYAGVGIAVWVAVVQSGVHASIAGVLIAAVVPSRPRLPLSTLPRRIDATVENLPGEQAEAQVLGDEQTHETVAEVERLAALATTPLRRWEDGLELPVALLILPLFALLNAGVAVDAGAFRLAATEPVAWGIAVGLVIGKPLGVVVGVFVGERLGLAVRPAELTDRVLLGVGLLAGVGFTMSTFIANLALSDQSDTLAAAKLAILLASAIAALTGFFLLRRAGTVDQPR